jgi:hypothetical protein
LFHNFFLLGDFIEVKFEKMVDGPHLNSFSGNLGGVIGQPHTELFVIL